MWTVSILGFLDWCVSIEKIDTLASFLLQNTLVFWSRGYWSELLSYLNIAYELLIVRDNNREVIARLRYEMGSINYFRGEIDVALELFKQSLEVFEELKNYEQLVGNYRRLAEIYSKFGDFEKAENFINKAYEAAVLRERPERATFRLKRYHASIELDAGNLELARELLTESIKYQEGKESIEEDSVLAISHALLGRVETLRGNYNVAQAELERALEVAKITQVKQDLAYILKNFAFLEKTVGNSNKSIDWANQALALYRQLGMKLNIVETKEIIAQCQTS